jgi:hypothetical protein
MGDRGQVKIISEGSPDLYLYTHWTAYRLHKTVADALNRGRGRWNDNEYLSRIIFSEMIKDEVLEETGYGIGFELHGDVHKLVVVNITMGTAGIMDNDYTSWSWTQELIPFEDFINEYSSFERV